MTVSKLCVWGRGEGVRFQIGHFQIRQGGGGEGMGRGGEGRGDNRIYLLGGVMSIQHELAGIWVRTEYFRFTSTNKGDV